MSVGARRKAKAGSSLRISLRALRALRGRGGIAKDCFGTTTMATTNKGSCVRDAELPVESIEGSEASEGSVQSIVAAHNDDDGGVPPQTPPAQVVRGVPTSPPPAPRKARPTRPRRRRSHVARCLSFGDDASTKER